MTYSNPEIPTRGAVGSGRGGPATAASGSHRLAIPPQTEKQFQAAVVELARLNKWLVYHTHDSRRSNLGFPDLVLVRPPRLIFLECKRKGGRITLAQRVWIDALRQAGAMAYLVTPDDWDVIIWLLHRRPTPDVWATDIDLQNDDAPPMPADV